MKKHFIILAVIAALSIGILSGQAPATASASVSTSSIHIVKSGDTLWDIARDNNVSVGDIVTWNQLDSVVIYPSQELIIKKEVETYVVVKGDTLFEIAENHNILLKELMEWNNISGHLIYPGDNLVLGATNESPTGNITQSHPTKIKTIPPAPPIAKAKAPEVKAPIVKTPTVKAPTVKAPEKVSTTAPPPAAKAPSPSSSGGKEMTVTATAYTAYCEGCSGITYTGIDLRSNPNQKVIAVDPRVIPLGSRVWVEGYGEAIAGDIGGAIKGNIIDVFLENRQDALKWGRKKVTIKILD